MQANQRSLLTRPFNRFARRQIGSFARLGGGLNRAWQQKRDPLDLAV